MDPRHVDDVTDIVNMPLGLGYILFASAPDGTHTEGIYKAPNGN